MFCKQASVAVAALGVPKSKPCELITLFRSPETGMFLVLIQDKTKFAKGSLVPLSSQTKVKFLEFCLFPLHHINHQVCKAGWLLILLPCPWCRQLSPGLLLCVLLGILRCSSALGKVGEGTLSTRCLPPPPGCPENRSPPKTEIVRNRPRPLPGLSGHMARQCLQDETFDFKMQKFLEES